MIAAATLSHRYISDRFLPDKAIDLMDEAAARLRVEINSMPAEMDEISRRILQLQIEKEALKKENDTAIILITHDMGVVAELADNVAVMYMGNIVEAGTADDVLRRPTHPYTKGLISSRPNLNSEKISGQRLKEIAGNVPNPNQRPEGCSFHPRCSWAFDKCKTQKPALQNIKQDRQYSCHLDPDSI